MLLLNLRKAKGQLEIMKWLKDPLCDFFTKEIEDIELYDKREDVMQIKDGIVYVVNDIHVLYDIIYRIMGQYLDMAESEHDEDANYYNEKKKAEKLTEKIVNLFKQENNIYVDVNCIAQALPIYDCIKRKEEHMVWWESLSSEERDEYFEKYTREMERLDLLRTTDVDELEECDIKDLYNDFYL